MQMTALSGRVQRYSRAFEKWFPTPRTMRPASLGVDISDSSVKWLGLMHQSEDKYKVRTYGSASLNPGIVSGGTIRDPHQLAEALSEIKEKFQRVERAHAALPEEAAYVFSMTVPHGSGRGEILRLIEFEFEGRVPIPPSSAIYDFDVVTKDAKEGMEIGVVVFPRDVAEGYASAFEKAGIELLSLEIEARSIARAVWAGENDPITLLVDFGIARTGFALIKNGIPIFTSTVDVGGDSITRAALDKLSLSPEKAEVFKNEQGLSATSPEAKAAVEAMTQTANALSDEIAKHFHYWDTRRDGGGERVTPVGRVLLVGGSANLEGLPSFIAAKVQAPVERGNVWNNVATFDTYIPPVDFRTSMQYATAIGLGLRGI
jgi:type IV pilus assembly protein PilM